MEKKIRAELESVKKQRDEMEMTAKSKQMTVEKIQVLLREKEEKIKHMEEFILPFVNKFYQHNQGQSNK